MVDRKGHEVISTDNGYVGINFEIDGSDPVCLTNQHTFAQLESFAKSKNGRLCTSEEIDELRQKKFWSISDKSYLAVKDADGDKWMRGSRYSPDAPEKLIDTKDVPDWNKFQNVNPTTHEKTPTYWVGTMRAWCDDNA